MPIIVAIGLRSPWPSRNFTTSFWSKDGFKNDATAVGSLCDYFMSGDERKRR
jgi:hypothetical protein